MKNWLFLLPLLILACRTVSTGATPDTMSRAVAGVLDGDTAYQRYRPDSVQRPDSFTFPPLRNANFSDYLPDTLRPEYLPERRIRLNFHVMNSADTLYDMTGPKAVEYSEAVLAYTNAALRENMQSWLYASEAPPAAYPARIQFVLPDDPQTGRPAVYEHFDEDLYGYVHTGRQRNRASRTVLDKYDVRPDEELNIYWMGAPRESIEKMGKKRDSGDGIYLGSAIKVTDVLSYDVAPWSIRKVFEHELGHALGLWHAWGNDGCDDTPTHKNDAWKNPNRGPGRSSNNLMDYSPDQKALTPCQIGTMQATLADVTKRQRGWQIRDWCEYRPDQPIIVTDSLTLNGARDFASDVIVRPGGALTINNRVSLPEGATIRVDAGATLHLGPRAILHNDCGGIWAGIWVADEGGRAQARVITNPAATLLNVAP